MPCRWLAVAATAAAAPASAVLVTGAPPVTKVVNLLQDLQSGLEKEAKEEKDTYDSLRCWCDKNGQEKGDAVDAAKGAIDSLQGKIEGGSGRTGQLGAELEHLKRRIAEDEASLREAIGIRKKEAGEFHEQEKELITSIRLLDGAVTTLAKHHPSMLQQTTAELQAMRPQLRHLVHKHIDLLGFLRTSEYKDTLLSLIDANSDILEDDHLHPEALDEPPMMVQRGRRSLRRAAQPVFKSYAPQSGQVLGVLKQMKEAFEEDLPQIQKAERLQVEQFNMMKGAKESEISSQRAAVKSKGGDLADTNENMWTNRNDIKDAKASLAADQAFLQELTQRCDAGGREYEKRSQMRSEEISAVSEAIKILTVDEVRDAQATTFGGAALLQLATSSADRKQVVRFAQEHSARFPNLAMVALAARDQPFKKVVAVIDDLVQKLKQQQADAVKMRDFCISELHENQVDTERKTAEHDDLKAKAEELTDAADNLVKYLDQLRGDVRNLHSELQRASEDRKKENLEFRQVVGDQRALQQALREAQGKLRAVFEERQHEALLLQQEPEAPQFHERGSGPRPTVAPAPEFQDYDTKSGATTNVLTMMQKIIGEAKILEDASVHDEQNAQKAYETFISETNDSVKAKSKMIVDKTQELAETEEQLHGTHASAERALADLQALADTSAAVHKQCDFLLNNFEASQKARGDEIVALGDAKAMVSGMQSKA